MTDQLPLEIPFETDDVLARRLRAIGAELQARDLVDFARELRAVAEILDPKREAAA